MSDDLTKKDRTWLLPESSKAQFGSGLYLVATPIGNLGDITLRALDALEAADIVLCEDTRVSGKLLAHFGIKAKLGVYNDHSREDDRTRIIGSIRSGSMVALISDAGTPLVSDPGYKLVRACQDADLPVTALPGANAPLTALQLSGLPSDHFVFAGFLPSKQGQRQKALARWGAVDVPLIVFESGKRLCAALEDIASVLGARDVVVARELTKRHEEVRRGAIGDLIAHYTDEAAPKGEIVLVIAAADKEALSEADVDAALREALQSMPTKKAAAHVAQATGLSKSALYDRVLALKDES